MFRRRFWVSLVLSIPVLLYSPMLQEWLGFSMPAFPGSDWIAPAFRRRHLRLRRRALPADGRAGAAQPPAGDDDPDLAGDQRRLRLQPGGAVSCPDRRLFLGAGHADRHHAAGPLDRDAQRAPGVRRAERAGQADARHRRAHPCPMAAPKTVPVSQLRNGDLVLVRPGSQRPGRRRGGGGRVGCQRGHDHRRVASRSAKGRAAGSSPARSTATAACACG